VNEHELHLKKLKERRNAYVAIFGDVGQPTPYGQIILDDLKEFCAVGRESIHMDSNGRMDPYTTIYRDGKKAVFERIIARLTWREPDAISSRSIDHPDTISSSDPNP
jgi:hypothetical protein